MRKVAIVVENFTCTEMFGFAISNATHFSNGQQNVKISIFPFTLSGQKCYIFKSISTNFQKLFFGRTMRKVAIVVENLNCTDVLVLQWQRHNFSNIWEM